MHIHAFALALALASIRPGSCLSHAHSCTCLVCGHVSPVETTREQDPDLLQRQTKNIQVFLAFLHSRQIVRSERCNGAMVQWCNGGGVIGNGVRHVFYVTLLHVTLHYVTLRCVLEQCTDSISISSSIRISNTVHCSDITNAHPEFAHICSYACTHGRDP